MDIREEYQTRLFDHRFVYVDIDWHIAHDGGEGPNQESLIKAYKAVVR